MPVSYSRLPTNANHRRTSSHVHSGLCGRGGRSFYRSVIVILLILFFYGIFSTMLASNSATSGKYDIQSPNNDGKELSSFGVDCLSLFEVFFVF